jgi:hypothetical protein
VTVELLWTVITIIYREIEQAYEINADRQSYQYSGTSEDTELAINKSIAHVICLNSHSAADEE